MIFLFLLKLLMSILSNKIIKNVDLLRIESYRGSFVFCYVTVTIPSKISRTVQDYLRLRFVSGPTNLGRYDHGHVKKRKIRCIINLLSSYKISQNFLVRPYDFEILVRLWQDNIRFIPSYKRKRSYTFDLE